MADDFADMALPDQAQGLRQRFAGLPTALPLLLLHNPAAICAGLVLERLAAAAATLESTLLVVDAAPGAAAVPACASLGLSVAVERLPGGVHYLPARGLIESMLAEPLAPSTILRRLARVAPPSARLLLHAGAATAAPLGQAGPGAWRPILISTPDAASLTCAYEGWKRLHRTDDGPALADLIVVGEAEDAAAGLRLARRQRAALADCAGRFLDGRIGHLAWLDPRTPPEGAVAEDLRLLLHSRFSPPAPASQPVAASPTRSDDARTRATFGRTATAAALRAGV